MVGEPHTSGSISGTKSLNHYDVDEPLFLHPSDIGVVSIITLKFSSTENFRIWKSSMTRALKGMLIMLVTKSHMIFGLN